MRCGKQRRKGQYGVESGGGVKGRGTDGGDGKRSGDWEAQVVTTAASRWR